MLITTLVNTLATVNHYIYSNHIRFFVKSIKDDSTLEFDFFTPNRMSIDTARNHAGKIALENDSDYLLFIDDDVMIPNDTLHKLLTANKDVIAGLVIIRGYPFHNMAFKFVTMDDPNNRRLINYNELPLKEPCKDGHLNFEIKCNWCKLTPLQELVKVDAVGFSCCLIKTELLKAMEPPWFITGLNHTEDIYFCLSTLNYEPKPEIYLHTGVECGHLLNPEPIEWRTRAKMQEFYADVATEPYKRNLTHIAKNLTRLS